MICGKITANFDGDIKEKEIDPCDMVIAVGIKKIDETPKDATIDYQSVIAGGGGLSKRMLINTLPMWIADLMEELGDSPEEAAILLKAFLDAANKLKDDRLKEQEEQMTSREE